MKLAIPDDGGESLLLDRGRTQLNALQYTRVQDVHTGINAIADELDRFLDESVDTRGVVGLVDDNTIF